MKLLSLNNRFVFNLIFAENPDLLKALFNSILRPENEDEIQQLHILIPDRLGTADSRIFPQISEIKAIDSEGRYFTAETDTIPEKLFLKEASHSADSEAAPEKRIYSFHFLNRHIFNNFDYMSKYRIIELESSFKRKEDLQICIIEFPKFNKAINDLSTSLDRWLYFMKNSGSLTDDQEETLMENDLQIKNAIKFLKTASNNPENWAIQMRYGSQL